MAGIAQIQEEITEEFQLFDEPMMQYEYIIDLGKKLPEFPEAFKNEAHVVKGCQSTVWLRSYMNNDERIYFEADSNSVITKGIIALLIRVLSGHRPEEVVAAELNFVDKINLRSHLSQQRSNGLNAMIRQMKLDAMAHLTQKTQK
ncbi:MAG: SufE family protein [Bacteroidia bacterium]